MGENRKSASRIVGINPLMDQCLGGHLDKVRNLLDAKEFNIDEVCSTTGDSALNMAAIKQHVEIVKELLDRGASPDIKNEDGETFLDCLSKENRRIIREYMT